MSVTVAMSMCALVRKWAASSASVVVSMLVFVRTTAMLVFVALMVIFMTMFVMVTGTPRVVVVVRVLVVVSVVFAHVLLGMLVAFMIMVVVNSSSTFYFVFVDLCGTSFAVPVHKAPTYLFCSFV